MDVLVREARDNELGEVGAVTAAAYDGIVSPEYLVVLRDARPRRDAPHTTLLVALDDGTEGLLGTVVYAAAGSPYRNLGRDAESEIRMLGVLAAARGRGVGEALVQACVARAKAQGCPRLVLSTEPEMLAAQRLYTRLGFARTPQRDWTFKPGLSLLTYALELG
ncbi:GNAT family N-acetyltransferase [Actinocrinis puniceicyclus]|uniref:GNAT family N-acetyltransferase n=1 Tax=Actinocrinis puniceicyclus TaxID=977794 RepID=A0A8J7WQ72_9ACTN|nr:GNAT family N-acetyltransferase [Actinocrinis puniceicyclus]MBS2963887.1 GNAT family N-acetyltransferase [Actinocrinis puniceicyclus]